MPNTGGYHHNNWLSPDGRYAFATEEIPSGRPILVIDLQDIGNANLEIAASFFDPLQAAGVYNAIPHNVYIKDNLLFNSQYEDGLLVYDISDPLAPKLRGYYDTHPQNTQYNTYYGCWGNYPWLPSGTIIAGDMQNGLQLLKFTGVSSTSNSGTAASVRLYPNPVQDLLTIALPESRHIESIRLSSLTGQIVLEKFSPANSSTQIEIPTGRLTSGVYIVAIQFENGTVEIRKLVKN